MSARLAAGVDAVSPAVASVALALVLDVVVAEPPARIHPVALFGRAVTPLDREWSRPAAIGLAVATTAPLIAATGVGSLVAALVRVSDIASVGVAGLFLFSTVSLRRLLGRAEEVIAASEADPDRARDALPALAGRDAAALSPGQLRSAAVESLAENLADGFVAPLLAFVVGAAVSLPVAVAAAVWVKGVNTLDSMLGYRTKSVGRASARLDDLVMWLPAHLTALLFALAARDPGAVRRARAWADAPASPNSGWPMATLATVLSVRLEKPGGYTLGSAAGLPRVADGVRAIRVTRLAGALAGTLALVGAGVAAC